LILALIDNLDTISPFIG